MTPGAVQYEVHILKRGDLAWALERRWTILQSVPERWGWHTVRWVSVRKDFGWRANKYTYPLIPPGARFEIVDKVTFNRWWELCQSERAPS